jgi:iron complex outermembrane receptor protein
MPRQPPLRAAKEDSGRQIMQASSKGRRAWFGSAATLALALADAAYAQQAAEPAGLEEIVVTAERREQRLQEVPISATVLSANEIARRGVQDISNLQQVAPSVAINVVNRSVFVNIRGVGIAQSAPTSNPGVAYYIDGQLIPHEQFIGQSFFDIASIEVLRGPQGTLTGQNSTGGAVYVRTPDPRYGETSGYFEQTVGNYQHYRTLGAVNVGFNDNVALRLAMVHESRDSFVDNVGPSPSNPGNLELSAARATLAFRSSDSRLRGTLRADYFNLETDNIAVKNRVDAVTSNPWVIEEDAYSYLNQEGYRLSGELRYELVQGVDVRALTSWQDGFTKDQVDGDRTATARPVPANLPTTGANTATFPGRVSRASTYFRTWINEVNVLSTGDGPVNWVAGAFFLNEFIPLEQLRDNRNTVQIAQSNSTTVTKARNTTKSVFGQVNWFITPRFEVLAGGRYSWDTQAYDRVIVAGTVQPDNLRFGLQKSKEWTGKVGANLHLADGSMLYATASKGYKAGGVNLTPNTPNFEPEKNYVYELGAKTELLGRRLRINGDVFYSDYKDIQLSSLFAGLPQTQNAASGTAYGAELEVTGQFGALGFNAGAGYLIGEFAKDVCINNTNNSAGTRGLCPSSAPTTADELVPEGRALPYSPQWTINAGVQYAFAIGGGNVLTPRLQWAHLSHQVATPFPGPRTIVPSRDVLDARLTFDFGDRYRLEGYVNNFTDETYIASQIQNASSADGGYVYGAPRQYGVRATLRFGG